MAVHRTNRTVYFDVSDEISASIAEKVAACLKQKNILCTVGRHGSSYAGRYAIAEADADYTVKLEVETGSRKTMKVCPLYVKNCTGSPRRDTARSHDAEKRMEHALRLTGRVPDKGGSELIPWAEIKDIPWYWENAEPYLLIKLYCRPGKEDELAQAVADGIKSYFGR